MPTKLKPSVKHYDRKTGKSTVEHFYIKNVSYKELEEIMLSERANPKLRIKCKRELTRRIKNGRHGK
jgi:Cu/Ag efflux protein CusF